MTFEEAGQHYAAYRAQADAGQLRPADFEAAVAQLKVQDPSGVWWQMGPAGDWLSWNGAEWVSQAQPAQATPPAASAQAQWNTPGKGNQIFWDVLSVAGSAAMAFAWYWYTSLDKSLNQPDTKSAVTMVVLPILFIVLRGPLDRLLAPIQKYRQSIPPMVLVGVGIIQHAALLHPVADTGPKRHERPPMMRTLRRIYPHLALAQIFTGLALLLAMPLFADDCGRDLSRAEDCMRTPGFAQGLGTAAGVIATVLVNGAAITTLVLSPRQPVKTADGGTKEPEEPPKQYFLNIQSQESRTQLKPDGKDQLWIFVQVTCSDPKVDCTGLTSAVSFHPGGANGSWLQLTGEAMNGGYKAVCVSAAPPSPADVPQPGGASVTAGVSIEGKPVYGSLELQIDTQVLFTVVAGGSPYGRFDREEKVWRFPQVCAYFHSPDSDQPVKPVFKYGFVDPPLTTEPANLLTVEKSYSQDDGLTWDFYIKGDNPAAFVQAFGPDLDQKEGKFDVIISVVDETQKPWSGKVTLSIAPEVVMMLYGFEEDSRVRAEKRTYKEVEFNEFEFISDAADELQVAALFVRSDKLEEGKDPADYVSDAVDFVRVDEVSLSGNGSDKFAITGDAPKGGAAVGPQSIYEFKIKALKPLLALAENQGIKLNLYVRASLTGPAQKQYATGDVRGNQALQQRPMMMKLIVAPSNRKNFSDAYLWVGTSSGTPKPLPQTEVEVEVVNQGDGSAQLTVDGPSEKATNRDGVAMFALRYSGLQWKTVGQARFKVRAGIKTPDGGPEKATYFEIDVNANGNGYIDAIYSSADSLRLNNPRWKTDKRSFLGFVGDMAWPDSMTGPLNNILCAGKDLGNWGIQKGGGEGTYFDTSPYEPYVCREMRDRIFRYSVTRKFSPDQATALAMNGLEFDTYEIAPIHVFAGVNLSGTEDPYFLDPWWDQCFNKDKVVLTYTTEVVKLGAAVALVLTVGAAVMVACGKAATLTAAVALIRAWLTTGIYRTLAGGT
ncbi:MAG: hypothetical protein NTY38_16470, partial [Acidobacteria bacterium]|nr:hypothetical protein [Acidobacteriota bacterium]